ncbi:MAG: helix-turn-helix domain-containing protein [Clostridium sp.]
MILIDKDLKFKIISDGINNGVTYTCQKYNISRTLYYRWLNRYKSTGIDGLDKIPKTSTPINKTDAKVEAALLNLIKQYPSYGPRYIRYIFKELGYNLSESAIYNIMKRNNLTTKESRLKFAKTNKDNTLDTTPNFNILESGECWLFWITDYGLHSKVGHIFQYTFFDYKSKIACSRLYNEVTFDNFDDILTSTAIPIAKTLNLPIHYLCFFNNNKLLNKSKKSFDLKINKLINDNAFDFKVHILSNENEEIGIINSLRKSYTEASSSFLMPLINNQAPFHDIKQQFQDFIRNYNITYKSKYANEEYTPVEYHNKMTNSKLILPMFAYLNREY